MAKKVHRGGTTSHRALFDTGTQLLRLGRSDDAAQAFARAIETAPPTGEYYARLAEALGNVHKFDGMAQCCRQGLERCGDDPQLFSYLGIALFNLEQWMESAVAFGRLIRLRPEYYKGYYLLALAFMKLGEPQRALNSLELACARDPKRPEVWMASGDFSLKLGDWQRSLVCFERALELQPDSVPAINNISVILRQRGDAKAAEPYLRRAVRLEPRREEPLRNLAVVLDQLGRRSEALDVFDRVLHLHPDSALSLAHAHWLSARLCLWDRLPEYERRILSAVERGDGQIEPFVVLCTSATPAQQLRCAAQCESARPIPGLPNLASRLSFSRDRLRVGYISADFQEHATAWLMAGMIECHDRARFEIYGYSYGKDNGGQMRTRLSRAFDRFADVSEASFEAAARAISDDGIDILVDLKGHTKDSRSRILAWRPAPVQVAYLGYPGSMGASYIDYAIADPYVIPPGAEVHFSEKIAWLPHCYQVNDRTRPFAEQPPSRSEYGLPEEGVILCSFNLAYKITPAVFDSWMRLLRENPHAVLWILESDDEAIRNLRREASTRGVADERLIFAPRLPMDQHLRRLRIADLMLDTFPVNAHTSASDALWSGCPVLTRSGDTFVSRVAGSLLNAVGLPELITGSVTEYEAKALHLVSQPGELKRLRNVLEANRLSSPLFDTAQTTRHIETAFETMWRIRSAGEQPRSFHVSSSANAQERL